MEPQGKREISQAVIIGALIALCTSVAEWTVGEAFRALDARRKAAKKKSKRKG